MPPELTDPQTPPAPAEPSGDTATPPTNTNAVFTQEDINRFVAAERRTYQQKLNDATAELERLRTAPKPTPKEDEPTLASLRAELQSERNARVFAEATSGKPLNPQQRGMLRKLFDAETPDDPVAWAENMIAAFGVTSPPVSPQVAAPPPPGNMPAATTVPNLENLEVHWKDLTPEQQRRMGEHKVLEYARAYNKRHSR